MTAIKIEALNIRNGALNPSSYTDGILLAANVPENFTVPTDGNTGLLASYVSLARTGDCYVKMYSTADGADRETGGTFSAMVTNGTFTTDTDWTKGTGWAISAGAATATTASTAISQTAPVTLIPGQIYTITYDVTRSAGTVTPSLGGTAGTARSTSATFTETITAGADGTIAFTGVGFTGTVDNVIVTAWVLGTGWTTDNATAIATGAISTAISQTVPAATPLVSGAAYLVTFTLTRSAGSIAVSLGGGTAGTSRSTSATFTEMITAGTTQVISFATTGFTGTLDTITVIPAVAVLGDSSTGIDGTLYPGDVSSLVNLNGKISLISVVSAGTPTITASYYM